MMASPANPFSDQNQCIITIDTVAPYVTERATWFDLWAGGVAAYTICYRYRLSGVSIGLGRSAHLYIYS